MSDDHLSRQPLGTPKARPLWRPLDSLRASMVKQVFSREHFTHKKGLLFTPTVHADEGLKEIEASTAPPAHATDEDAVVNAQAHDTPEDAQPDPLSIEEIRAHAFAEGLAQGVAQAQQQALQDQTAQAHEQLAAQNTAHTQALLQEIAQKVDALAEDPAQLQEPLKRLALHLAEQLVLAELSLSPQAIAHVIERCIETLDASDAATLVVELNAQDLALLQNLQREEGQPKPAWRFQADPLLLPGSVRVRADDAVVSDLIENRLESLAHSLLKEPPAWQTKSAFSPTKLASRLAAQRGSARTVEDAQAKAPSMTPVSPIETPADTAAFHDSAALDAAPPSYEVEATPDEDAHDPEEKHTYEAHEVMKAAPPPAEAMAQQFNDTLNDITLELDKLND